MATSFTVLGFVALVASALPAFAQNSAFDANGLHAKESLSFSGELAWDPEHEESMSHPPHHHGPPMSGDFSKLSWDSDHLRPSDFSWDSNHPRPSDVSWISGEHHHHGFPEDMSNMPDMSNFSKHGHREGSEIPLTSTV
ncbi:hypothetical protein LPJ64_005180 [Coemansia asiatica]|uniref:Uncharacterized protein n=1 Tax=Coemansia asiatica TaxID=1052880 RepID=A0A9W8CGM6_9FUNG|nr:hypothetical protein LPJ64_005180 [Coemansia asiatica]